MRGGKFGGVVRLGRKAARHRLRPNFGVEGKEFCPAADVRLARHLVRKQAGDPRRLRFRRHHGHPLVQGGEYQRVGGGIPRGGVLRGQKQYALFDAAHLCMGAQRLFLRAVAEEGERHGAQGQRRRKGV